MTVYEEHWGDEPACCRCETSAVVTISNRCCGHPRSVCEEHYADWRARVTAKLGLRIHCYYNCGYITPCYGFDFFMVVDL